MLNSLKILSAGLLGIVIFSTGSLARDSYNDDMALICKYEAQRNYGVPKSSSKIFPSDHDYAGFTMIGQSPRDLDRSLFYKCQFNNYGEFKSIEKIVDNRYYDNHNEAYQVTKRAKRVCKGEASTRWRTRASTIRINRTEKIGQDEFKVYLSRGDRRGICNISNSGHIYNFKTIVPNRHINNISLREARDICTRKAATRWGVNSNRIRVLNSNKYRNDYSFKLALRRNRAQCEVSRRGHIYNFSEY